jgi:hypothetical protein
MQQGRPMHLYTNEDIDLARVSHVFKEAGLQTLGTFQMADIEIPKKSPQSPKKAPVEIMKASQEPKQPEPRKWVDFMMGE